MKKLTIIFPLLLFYSFIYSQSISVEGIDVTNTILPNDIIYSLPKTILQQKIKFEESIHTPPKKLNISLSNIFNAPAIEIPSPISSETRLIKIKNFSLNTLGVPDDSHIYRIHLKKKWNKENKVGLKIGQNGLIQGGELTSQDKTFKIITSVLSGVISLFKVNGAGKLYNPEKDGGNLFNKLKLTEIQPLPINSDKNFEIIKSLRALLNQRNSIDVDLKSYKKNLANLKKDFVNNNRFGDNLNVFKYKVNMLGEMIKSLNQEKEKTKKAFIKTLNSFIGTLEKREVEIKADLDVQFDHKEFQDYDKYFKLEYPAGSQDVIINISSKSVYDNNDDGERCENCFRISIKRDINDFGKDFYLKLAPKSTNTGLAYKFPASYTAKVYTNNVGEIGSFTFFAVGKMHGRLPSKTKLNNLVYYSDLGWFKEINASTNSINPDDVTSLGKSIGETIDLINGDTEIESLKEETDLLELRIKKAELEKQIKEAEVDDN
ncbi:hypothetical protein [Zobellia nedashkovskayae]|uniref:hypothetical protein n=1 Tax=Zobellia nedashkovskayae TaxID=2779510 RepID=UPI00188B99CC|nr:hypothetical protein [Zobellia nedashkovskayae]